MNTVPKFHQMFNPLLEAFRNLDGSGRNDELAQEVVRIMGLGDDVAAIPHGKGGQSEVAYRLTWAQTFLKKYGLLDNSARGVWSLTPKGSETQEVDVREVVDYVHKLDKTGLVSSSDTEVSSEGIGEPKTDTDDQLAADTTWKGQTMQVLLSLEPSAFERLVIRILRESGFDDVKVTGKSGDGGIDGKGIVRVSGLLSFHAIVQCKRYKPDRLVTPSEMRDFRGAMQGRTDKGIFITTSGFTKAAVEEATRDGAPPLDLINGEKLVEILRELKLGISSREIVVVDEGWFTKQ